MVPRCAAAVAAALVVLSACGSADLAPPRDAVFTVVAGAPVCVDRPAVHGALTSQAMRTPMGREEPTRFARCRHVNQIVPGRGEWLMRTEERADGDIAALAVALRLPDDGGGADNCPAIGIVLPEVYAVDATGRAVLVRWPLGACSQPRPEVAAALAALRWTPEATRQVRQVRTQAVIDSGCGDRVKNMAAVEGAATDRPVRGGSPESLAVPKRVWACTYAIDEHGDTPEGSYASGGRTTVAVWRAVVLALRTAPLAPPGCTTQGRRFTVLHSPEGWVFIERDGCRRVLLPDGGLRVATPQVLQALAPH